MKQVRGKPGGRRETGLPSLVKEGWRSERRGGLIATLLSNPGWSDCDFAFESGLVLIAALLSNPGWSDCDFAFESGLVLIAA